MSVYHGQQSKEVLEELSSSADKGLSVAEAAKRLKQDGENRLKGKKGRSRLEMVIDQFKSFLVLILLAACILSFVTHEVLDAVVILVIVLLNAVLGFVQENKADQALKALRDLASPKATVLRDEKTRKVSSVELVKGDIVLLEAGSYVPADIRLIEAVRLQAQEAALTGESLPVSKKADAQVSEEAALGDRKNMLFAGTLISSGRAKGIVVATAMDTEIGRIADMLSETEDEETPLQKKLGKFGRLLAMACLVICLVIFGLGFLRGMDLKEIAMTAISLAVAAIPEGLPAVVTIVLALGMQRMVGRNAIIKRLSAVETLGSTTTICTDKTGTLTQNKMTVKGLYLDSEEFRVSGDGYSAKGEVLYNNQAQKNNPVLSELARCAALCNDADLDLEKEKIIGDPTEACLLVLAEKLGVNKKAINQEFPRIDEIPFDSKRKMMSTLHKTEKGNILYTKGAPDIVLKHCQFIKTSKGVQKLDDAMQNQILEANARYADQAMRVLAFAFKQDLSANESVDEENALIFLGLSAAIDPPREEVRSAINLCKKAGIRTVMITGDHKTTAAAIASDLGILSNKIAAIDGSEIDDYDDESFAAKVKDCNVFARVSPKHKVRIVKSIRENGEIASMTGDGVNDAPALKAADIGVAMGITGTDVSKEAADMILTDDNFSSIVSAIEQGRIIYSNIRKFVTFLLSCNIGEILIIFVSMIIGFPVPLLPIQLLWINLMTDSFPAFALGLEKGEKDIMLRKPRDPEEPIINRRMVIGLAVQSVFLCLGTLISFLLIFYFKGYSPFDVFKAEDPVLVTARTACFVTLVAGELLRAYSARSEKKMIFTSNPFANPYLNFSVLGGLLLLFAVLYLPGIQVIFSVMPLAPFELLLAFSCAVFPLIGGELAKLFRR